MQRRIVRRYAMRKIHLCTSSYNIMLICVCVFMFLNCFVYVRSEDTIYAWDFNAFWAYFIRFGQLSDWDLWYYMLTREIAVSNPIPTALLTPIYKMFGGSRLVYISSVALLYFMPACILLASLFAHVYDNKNIKFFVLLVTATFVPFWRPILRGYPDIIILAPIIISLIVVLKNDFSLKINYKWAIILGILIWLPFLFRRWLIYTVFSLYLTLPILSFLWASKKQNYKNIIYNFVIAGASSLFFVLFFQYDFIKMALTTDYGYQYSAYQFSFPISLKYLIASIGYYITPFFILGIFSSLKNWKEKSSKLCIISIINAVLILLFFTRTQSPGTQHFIPILFFILIASIVGAIYLLDIIRSSIQPFVATAVATVILICCILVMAHTFYPSDSKLVHNNHETLSKEGVSIDIFQVMGTNKEIEILPFSDYPFRTNDLDKYLIIINFIKNQIDTNKKVLISASSQYFGRSILNTISKDHGIKIDSLHEVPQIDLRDDFQLTGSLNYDYVILSDPIQLHLPHGQEVIRIFSTNILRAQNIGKAYKKTEFATVTLNGNIKVDVYKRERDFSKDEVEQFIYQLVEVYPEWEEHREVMMYNFYGVQFPS